MPWSEWQQEDGFLTDPNVLEVNWSDFTPQGGNQSTTVQEPPGLLGFYTVHTPNWEEYGTSLQFSPPPGWESYKPTRLIGDTATGFRAWFPDELFNLTEGVDYAPRPDRGHGDLDYYVEYEAGPTVHLGWSTLGTPRVKSVSTNFDPNPWTWRFGVAILGSPYVVGNSPGLPPAGVPYASGTDASPAPASVVDADPALPGPGNLSPFLLTASIPPFEVPEGQTTQGRVEGSATPFFLIRMPRFRYWLPGEDEPTVFPLRQKQRNDGLARGVYRARSTSSIQNSVRQNSYR